MLPLLLFFLPLLALAQINGNLPNQGTGNNRVTITQVPTENAAALSRVTWNMPVSQVPLFCVGSGGVRNLRFTCNDCNSTIVDQWLTQATKSYPTSSGFIAVQITNLQLNKTMNGKMLECEGEYDDIATQGSALITTSAVMDIRYLERPVIVNANGEGPVHTQNGNRFYLQRGSGSMELRCKADGNPAPNKFQWHKDGISLGNGQSLSVGQRLLGESISCAASSAARPQQDSEAVKIAPWDVPKPIYNNLRNLASDPANRGVFGGQGGNKAKIGQTVKMTCIASGNPQPKIQWLTQPSGYTNTVFNATCSSSQQIRCTPGQRTRCNPYGNNQRNPTSTTTIPNTVYVVASECSMTVTNYSFSGNFWCSACNKVSATSQHCIPPADRPPSGASFQMGVMGQPMRANDPPSAFQEGSDAIVSSYYCADPPPEGANFYWTIGGQRLGMGQSMGNFQAEQPRANGTGCYTAQLKISPVTESDLSQTTVLTLQNTYGKTDLPVNIRQLLSPEDDGESAADIGLIVGLTLGILLFLCLLIPACMWWRGWGCFAGSRKEKPEKFSTNRNYNERPVEREPFIAPEHVRSEPAPINGGGYTQQEHRSAMTTPTPSLGTPKMSSV